MRRESKPSKASWSQNDMNGEHLSPKTRELLEAIFFPFGSWAGKLPL